MKNLYQEIKSYNHNYKPLLVQNFLINDCLGNQIINHINDKSKKILEIGPGLGTLTDKLIKLPGNITVIEKDLDLKPILLNKYKNIKNINLIFDDFINYNSKNKIDTIIGNLPYQYIKEIFFKLISIDFAEGIFMISENYKKELLASIGSKNYTSLSFLINFFFNFEILIDDIRKDNFIPESGVISCVIKIIPKYKLTEYMDIRNIFSNISRPINELPNINPLFKKEKYTKQIKDLTLKDFIYIDPLKEILLNNLSF